MQTVFQVERQLRSFEPRAKTFCEAAVFSLSVDLHWVLGNNQHDKFYMKTRNGGRQLNCLLKAWQLVLQRNPSSFISFSVSSKDVGSRVWTLRDTASNMILATNCLGLGFEESSQRYVQVPLDDRSNFSKWVTVVANFHSDRSLCHFLYSRLH